MKAANGGEVISRGTIKLDWRWSLNGIKIHTTAFNVFDASHHNIILRNKFLIEEDLVSWNQDAFAPLTEHNPVISPCEPPIFFWKI